MVNAHENAFIHPEFSFFRAHVDRLVFDALPLPQSFLTQQEKRVNEDDSIDDALDDIFANRSLPDDLVPNMINPSRAKRILECKTANPFAQSAWGDTRTDQIPLAYLCQCAWYMAITQIEVTDLAVLFGNSDFRIYTITRDLELEHLILERAEHFWNEYVQKSSPPLTQSEGDCQALFQQHLPGKSIEANPQLRSLIMQLQELSAKASQTEKSMSQIRQSIMNEMGDAESVFRDGQILATWKLPKTSSRLDGKRLEKEHPDLYFSYQMPIQNSRRFVLKQGV
jgi:predicted phage-related endonuclease